MSKDIRTKRRERRDNNIKASGMDRALIEKKLKDNRKIRYESDLMIDRLSNWRKDNVK